MQLTVRSAFTRRWAAVLILRVGFGRISSDGELNSNFATELADSYRRRKWRRSSQVHESSAHRGHGFLHRDWLFI
jgi:hypothetical protein